VPERHDAAGPRRPSAAVPPLAGEHHVCGDCRLAYAQISIAHAVAAIGSVPDAARTLVAAVPERLLRQRPAPQMWSVTEYICHLRDVYATYTIRLHRTRTEDAPVLEPMLNDLRARRFRYNELAAGPVLDEVAANVAGFRDEAARLTPADWDRVATRLPGETRTARWLARQAMHEGRHHLGDIRRVADAVAPPG
jgi:DinB superfamily